MKSLSRYIITSFRGDQVEVTIPIFQQVEQDLQTAMLESNALEMPAELVGLFDMSGGIAQQLDTLGRALSDVVARGLLERLNQLCNQLGPNPIQFALLQQRAEAQSVHQPPH